ncbi:hypothetical protein BD289DRAFT_424476 [Coniella lustricola]|uniref:RlpA-like double-psi beta-barrel-protein domain-containing protein-containing protein n=1 Tax=Coniella lustricola TaxID=2025994 RepID=A0A2T3AIJ4_9PEZI|nr:hypothetical protein BD289DRAFT_424476 [Coniella lustricola]
MPSSTKTTLLSLLAALTATRTTVLAASLPLGIRDDSASGVTHSGDITWYNTNNGVGACGFQLSDSEPICALSTALYDEFTKNGNPNDNDLCNKQVTITMTDGSKQTVKVADRCEACAKWDIDLTPTTFKQLVKAGTGVGRTPASWVFA